MPKFLVVPSASRSRYILSVSEAPEDQVFVSIKSGAPVPMVFVGETVKPFHAENAILAVNIEKYLSDAAVLDPLKYVSFVPEQVAITSDWQGQTYRDYSQFFHDGWHLLPMFTALHDYWGLVIALANNSDNPVRFWSKNLGYLTGQALFEQWFKRGMSPIDLHSQNGFLVLDPNFQISKSVVFRDHQYARFTNSDADLIQSHFAPLSEENRIPGIDQQPEIRVGFVHGLYAGASPIWSEDGGSILMRSHLEIACMKGFEAAAREMAMLNISIGVGNGYAVDNHLPPGGSTVQGPDNYLKIFVSHEALERQHRKRMENLIAALANPKSRPEKTPERKAKKIPYESLSEADLLSKFSVNPRGVVQQALVRHLKGKASPDLAARIFRLLDPKRHSNYSIYSLLAMNCTVPDLIRESFRRKDSKAIFLALSSLERLDFVPKELMAIVDQNRRIISEWTTFRDLATRIKAKHKRKGRTQASGTVKVEGQCLKTLVGVED